VHSSDRLLRCYAPSSYEYLQSDRKSSSVHSLGNGVEITVPYCLVNFILPYRSLLNMRLNLIKLASALLCAGMLLPASARAESLNIDDLLTGRSSVNQSASDLTITDLPPSPTAQTLLLAQTATAQTETAQAVEPGETSQESVGYPALPSVEEIQLLQEDLRNLNVPESQRRRRAYPSITISNPSGYGAHRGQIYIGAGIQSRSRYSGPRETLGVFSGGKRDGVAGVGFGIGDARESVGLQISYTAASFGGSRAPLSGGFNAKVHKQFGHGWAAAIGGEGIINFGRLPEDNDQIDYNDFEGTYYGAASYTIPLREDFNDAFSRLTLTGGAGSGRFRTVDDIANGEFAVGVFGSAALQVLPSTTLITEWTGQDLAVGASFAPFPNFPLVVTPAIRDIAGESDGTPRFVLGIGMSVSDAIAAFK